MTEPIIRVNNLKTYFYTSGGVVPAVDGISFNINPGETLAIVGESGSGKSVTSISIMRLVPNPPGKIVEGEILFRGEDLLKKSNAQMRGIRGNRISMIFQEPMTSLNPSYRVGDQIMEALRLHQGLNKEEALNKAIEMLGLVGIPSPEKRVHDFPHQLSGGMRQRVMIAMALSCHPELLIADEPTTALDVTIQAQILDLLRKLRKELGTSIMLITHDLGVVAEMADRVAVMYAGKIVEKAGVEELFANPLHPYTEGLLKSIPKMEGNKEKLYAIEGVVPNPLHLPPGCRFEPRCPHAQDICRQKEPALEKVGPNRWVSCWRQAEEVK